MTKKSGFAFHCHHHTLVEYVYDYAERREYIQDSKPEAEQKLRLRLFKMIPEDRLPRGWGTVTRAWAAYAKALAAYNKTCAASAKARAAYNKTGAAHDKAWATYLAKNKEKFEALHKELCPNCPWDGKTIFPTK